MPVWIAGVVIAAVASASEGSQAGSPLADEHQVPSFLDSLVQFGLRDLDGKASAQVRLSGPATILTIWATWCEHCRAEEDVVRGPVGASQPG